MDNWKDQEAKFGSLTLAPDRPSTQAKKKGPGGIAGFLTNSLPAIGGGLGAVAGIPLDIFGGAGSIAGGAGGAALGETLKRKIKGESLDPKQIAIQAAEGGATAAISPLKLLKGTSSAAKDFVTGGAKAAEEKVAQTTEKPAGSFLKNLTTQGQQAQGRTLGISAGSKEFGKALDPQDTERMLSTLKDTHGINTGNASIALRDIRSKLENYGKQISDHFKANNAPLTSEDKQVITDNYLKNLPSTDPLLAKKAQVLVNDFNRDVTDTQSMWKFRQKLDDIVPTADQAKGSSALTKEKSAAKTMRQYIANELGQVPGIKDYHQLAEIKPYVVSETRRLNNPSGGIIGRVLSSGAAQKVENSAGKITEKVAQIGKGKAIESAVEKPTNILDKVLQSRGIPVNFEDSTFKATPQLEKSNHLLVNPSVGDLSDVQSALKSQNYSLDGRIGASEGETVGRKLPGGAINKGAIPGEYGITPGTPIVRMTGTKTSLPFEQVGSTTKGIINTPDIYKEVQDLPISEEAKASLLNKLGATAKGTATLPLRAAAAPLAYPGKSAVQVGKQSLFRGFGIPAATSQEQPAPAQEGTTPTADLNAVSPSEEDTNSPFSQSSIQKAIIDDLAKNQGKNVSTLIDLYKTFGADSTKPLNSSQQQQANNAVSALKDIQSISDMLSKDPTIAAKDAVPGGGLAHRLTGTTDYEASKSNIVDVISRLRSGAAISASEEKLYKSLLPGPTDSAESAQSKLNRLTQLFSSFAQPQSTGGTDITDLLANQ